MADFATRVCLHAKFEPNPFLDHSFTDYGDSGGTTNPNVDQGLARTWSITCTWPSTRDAHGYYSVGEIIVQLNQNNTVKNVTMKLYGSNASDKSKWWGFTVTDGFSNDGDPSRFFVTGVTWVSGPNGPPAGIDPPKLTDISGSPEEKPGEKKS